MAHLFTYLVFGAVALVLRVVLVHLSNYLKARRHGCQDPPRLPNWDVLFGTDYFVNDLRAGLAGQSLPRALDLLRRCNHTYLSSSLFGEKKITFAKEENFRAFFSTRYSDWGVAPFREPGFLPFIGRGLISSDGEYWKHSSDLMKPFFHRNNINDLAPFEEDLSQLLTMLPNDGSTVDLEPIFTDLTFDSSARFTLGESLGRLSGDAPPDLPLPVKDFGDAFAKASLGAGITMNVGWLRYLLPASMTTKPVAIVHKVIDFYVNRAVEGLRNPKADPLHDKHSIINSHVHQTSDKIEIRNQVLHAILSGEKPIPCLMLHAIFGLSRRPDLWARLREEVLPLGPKPLTIDEALKLPFLNKVLKESLRVYGVFAALGKHALVDTVLPTGGGPNGDQPIFCPTGTFATAHLWALHHDEKVFGPHTDKFEPDRWDSINPGPWQFVPFSNGPRTCLGQKKAMGESACVLIRLAQKYRKLESKDDRDWRGTNVFVTRNMHGVKVGLIE